MADIDKIRKYVADELGGDDAGLVVTSALIVGPNIDRIAKFTGLSREAIRPYAERLRDNGIWVGGKINCDDPDAGPSGIELALWASVALGYLETAAV